MDKTKIIIIVILSIALMLWWFYNLNNFLLDPLGKKSNNFQSLQANTMIIASNIKGAMVFIIPIIAIVFLLYKIYLYRTRIFDVIPLNYLNRHLIILGPTGVGKTTIAKKIIKKVMKVRKELPIYIIDVHGEYDNLTTNDLFEKILKKKEEKEYKIDKITFDEKVSFNIFDPWNINPKRYIVFLTNTLKDILELSEPQTYILLRALEEEYRERGYYSEEKEKQDVPIPPDINDILERIKKMQPQSRFDYEIKVALEKLQPPHF